MANVHLVEPPCPVVQTGLQDVIDLMNVGIRRHINGEESFRRSFEITVAFFESPEQFGDALAARSRHEGYPICRVPAALHHVVETDLTILLDRMHDVFVSDAEYMQRSVLQTKLMVPNRQAPQRLSSATLVRR